MEIRIKRVYEALSPGDGARFLVDRLWPRGLRKVDAHLDAWLREAAPSSELRRWFGHDPARWEEFQRRYFGELAAQSTVLAQLRAAAQAGTVTLLYSARDEHHNQAAALKTFLENTRE